MGIKNKKPEALQALKDTLLSNPHITEVYFTRSGEHYFNTYELEAKGKKTGRKYGMLKTKAELFKVVGERRIYKNIPVHTPEAEIVETLSTEDVLDYELETSEEEAPGKPKSKLGKPGRKKKEAVAVAEEDDNEGGDDSGDGEE